MNSLLVGVSVQKSYPHRLSSESNDQSTWKPLWSEFIANT